MSFDDAVLSVFAMEYRKCFTSRLIHQRRCLDRACDAAVHAARRLGMTPAHVATLEERVAAKAEQIRQEMQR